MVNTPGTAPDASLVSLKVLDENGRGTISNVIAALDWVLANHTQYNIRVVNLSVGASVRESYWTDPLTLAAKRVVDAGVTVVAAAGNHGRNTIGQSQYGGITAPGNAPWVLTVGGSTTNGTTDRSDDAIARFSSRGPTYLDWSAKPDVAAPGQATVSLADPLSRFYTTKAHLLLPGRQQTAHPPVSHAQRDQHGCAGRFRHGRLDASGEPDADAECRESDSSVHRSERGLQRAD